MKKLLMTLFILLFLFFLVVNAEGLARTRDDPFPEGLVAHWIFTQDRLINNGTEFLDLLGKGNNATVVNPDSEALVFSDPEKEALRFNDYSNTELSGHIYLDLSTDLSDPNRFGKYGDNNQGALTITALVKVDDVAAWDIICSGFGPFGCMSFGAGDSKKFLKSMVKLSGCTVNYWPVSDPNKDLTTEWTHIAFILEEGKGYQYYIDGEAGNYVHKTDITFCGLGDTHIGKFFYQGDHFFNGSIREIKLWNRALSAEEIKAQEDGLVGHWRLDNDPAHKTETQFLDLSGNNNHATIENLQTGEDLKFIDGINGQALSFNGYKNENIYLKLPYIDTNDKNKPKLTCPVYFGGDGDLTLTALVKVERVHDWNIICSGCGPYVYTSFGTARNSHSTYVRSFYCKSLDRDRYSESYRILQDDTWTHIAFVLKEGEGNEYYINGILNFVKNVKDITLCEDFLQSYIGRYDYAPIGVVDPNDVFFNGTINEIKVWNRALSADEIEKECQGLVLCGDDFCDRDAGENEDNEYRCPSDCIIFGCEENDYTECKDYKTKIDPDNCTDYDHFELDSNNNFSMDVEIDAFEYDEITGLPKHPMVVEIRYQDIYEARLFKKPSFLSDPIRFGTELYNEEECGSEASREIDTESIGGYSSGKWKIEHILFKHSDWPRIRVTDGDNGKGYRFKFTAPESKVPRSINIDYISLTAIVKDNPSHIYNFNTLLQLERDLRHFNQENKTSTGSPDKSELWVFTKNPTESVYENTYPENDSQCDLNIKKRAARGEIFPLSFSVFNPDDPVNITVSISDLDGQGCGETIESTKHIKMYKVIQDLKFWTYWRYNDPYDKSYYGLQPDRIERIEATTQNLIEAEKTQRFWIQVFLPDNIPSGTYTGIITIKDGITVSKTIDVEITVLPFTPLNPKTISSLWANPRSRPYSCNEDNVYRNIDDHQLSIKLDLKQDNLVTYDPNAQEKWDTSGLRDLLNNLTDPNNYKYIIPEKIFVDTDYFFADILYHLDPNDYPGSEEYVKLYNKLSAKDFKLAYKEFITTVNQVTNDSNIEFIYTVIDEPGNNIWRRIVADRLYTSRPVRTGPTLDDLKWTRL